MQNHENFTYVPNDHVSHSLMCRVLGIWTKSMPALCTSKRINKCSRHKPYNFGEVGAQLYGKDGYDESVLELNNFGMVPAQISKPANGATTANGLVGQWGQWQPPQPGHAKRIDDFRMYWHLAPEHVVSVEYSSGSRPSIMPYDKPFWAAMTFTPKNGRFVTLDDMRLGGVKLSEMYLTIVIGSYDSSTQAYGRKWIIAQSDITLGTAVRGAAGDGSNAKNRIEAHVDLLAASIDNFTSYFGKHFMAIGYASKFSSGTKISYTSGGVSRTLYYYDAASLMMPLPLVSPDMYNKGFNLATVGETGATSSGESRFDCYVDLTYYGGKPTASFWQTTKNGVKGYRVDITGQFNCAIDSVAASMSGEGYIVFIFSVYLEGSKCYAARDYFVVMQKGCDGRRYLYLSASRILQAEPGVADATNSEVKDTKTWIKNNLAIQIPLEELPSDGIFIPTDDEYTSLSVNLDILGAPSLYVGNLRVIPDIKSESGKHNIMEIRRS